MATSDGSEVPVGSIVAYAAPDLNLLPSNWLSCDGSKYGTTSWPELYAVIRTCNAGSGGSSFCVPNLSGSFLRGSAPQSESRPLINSSPQTLNAGQVCAWRTANDSSNQIQVYFNNMPTNDEDNVSHIGNDSMLLWTDGSTTFNITSDDKETRPDNVSLFYVIKAAMESTKDSKSANIPIGSVIPYVGTTGPTTGVFPDWIPCTNEPVPVEQGTLSLQNLAMLLQNRFQPQGTAGDALVPPNLTGMFVRGANNISTQDKDVENREPAPDGTTSGVGTWQKWATSMTDTSINVPYYCSRTNDYPTGSGNHHIENSQPRTDGQWSGGGHETRPQNAAVQFWMYTGADPTKSSIPIGGVIAITQPSISDSHINQQFWQYCDGNDSVPSNELDQLVGSAWGQARDGAKAPDLRAQFLRGSNPDGNSGYNRDPDWNSRTASTGQPQEGVGSYQTYATGAPTNPSLPQPFMWWNGNNRNPTNIFKGGDDLPQYNGGTYAVSFPDHETAPVCVVVDFYVRIA